MTHISNFLERLYYEKIKKYVLLRIYIANKSPISRKNTKFLNTNIDSCHVTISIIK